MSEEEKVVTHEDIWDDSALVNSWNEALEEYKVSRIAAVLLLASISCALSRTTCLPVAEKKEKRKKKLACDASLPFFFFCSHRCPGGGPSGFLFFICISLFDFFSSSRPCHGVVKFHGPRERSEKEAEAGSYHHHRNTTAFTPTGQPRPLLFQIRKSQATFHHFLPSPPPLVGMCAMTHTLPLSKQQAD